MRIKLNHTHRLRHLTMAVVVGVSALALTACAPKQRSVVGDNVGRLVVVADDSVRSNVIMSVNGKYMNTLAPKRKFEQDVCVGEYTVKAASAHVTDPEPTQRLVRPETESNVNIVKGKTTYLQVSQTPKGWALAPASEQAIKSVKNYTEKDGKLVRRLPDYMINCK